MSDFSVIGKPIPLIDAAGKLTRLAGVRARRGNPERSEGTYE